MFFGLRSYPIRRTGGGVLKIIVIADKNPLIHQNGIEARNPLLFRPARRQRAIKGQDVYKRQV